MDFNDFYAAQLVNKQKSEVSAESTKGKLLLFYFSAHWCPPCRQFTPVLADFYAKLVEANKPIAIVFVSSDRDEEGFWDYFGNHHGDYLAVPQTNKELTGKLKAKYGIQGIPSLVVVKENGDVIDAQGRGKVSGDNVVTTFDEWFSQK